MNLNDLRRMSQRRATEQRWMPLGRHWRSASELFQVGVVGALRWCGRPVIMLNRILQWGFVY